MNKSTLISDLRRLGASDIQYSGSTRRVFYTLGGSRYSLTPAAYAALLLDIEKRAAHAMRRLLTHPHFAASLKHNP